MLQREENGWRSPPGTGHAEVDKEGQRKKQGNNGEDTELTGTTPGCPTSHETSSEMLTSQSMTQTACLNPVLSGGAIHLSMMRGHYK